MNERKVIEVAVTFDAASRRKDKSVRMAFTSNTEISSRDYMTMDELIQNEGWLIFSPNRIDAEDIPAEPAQSKEGKSFLERLRAIKYLQWKQTDESEPFEIAWARYKEAVLEREKERLDPR